MVWGGHLRAGRVEATAGSHLGHRGDAGSSAGEHLVVSAHLFRDSDINWARIRLGSMATFVIVLRGANCSLMMKSLGEPKLTVASSILAPFRRNDP
jgi:hypothetical protein